jgi:hypothetical protein
MPIQSLTVPGRSGDCPSPVEVYLIGYDCWGVVAPSPLPDADQARRAERAVAPLKTEITMSPRHRRYLALETTISVAINLALSAAFAWAVFGGKGVIPSSGVKGFGVDFLPQTFMISLMSVLVPTLLTRKRLSAGKLEGLEGGRPPWPLRILAPLLAIVATLVLGGVAALLSPTLAPQGLGFSTLMGVKLFYGAVIAVLVTPVGLVLALRDRRWASSRQWA